MGEKRIHAPATLDQSTGGLLFEAMREQRLEKDDTLTVDLSATESIDSQGGAWLVRVTATARECCAAVSLAGQQGLVGEFVAMLGPALEDRLDPARRRESIVDRCTEAALRVKDECSDFLNLFVDAIYWTLLAPLGGRAFRWGLLVEELHEMGYRAVRIVALMNFLLGLTIAMLSAAQLRQVGLDLYVANLVMIGFARELAAVMTAVVVAARTGAAIAAELATMKVQEEIDALRGMGLNVSQFLMAPKLLSLAIVMPLLTALGMFMGVLGGAVWGHYVLGFTADQWFRQTINAAQVSDVLQGLIKGFVFANAIVFIACHNGLRVEGGSRGVGLMTTRAVVMIIFSLIVIDMCFAVLFYYVLD
ncbi:MAG TPA: ABC transporter permease [Candidatus Hydrogenedentes bacterium]|nr:ABC transporter permease [Candidatus Hydrogenedentota bacterium]HOS02357.1 ABC transporter permease [Candidatus Hydrogenedentota bacterium]